MAVSRYDRPAEYTSLDTFVDTYVPIPFEEMMQVGLMKQQQEEQAYDALSKTYEDVYNLTYVPNSKDERYIKEHVIPTAKELFDRYSLEDLSDPIIRRQMRRDFSTKINTNKIKDIQRSYEGWRTHQVQKQRLASEDRLDPYEEDRSVGYDTSIHGVYSDFSTAYTDPIIDLQKKYFEPLKETLLRDEKGRLKVTPRGYNVEGVTQDIVKNVAEKNLDTEIASKTGRRAIRMYRERYGISKDKASDKEVLRRAFTDAGEPFIRETLTGSPYQEWMFKDRETKAQPATPISSSPRFSLAGTKEGDVPSVEDVTGIQKPGFLERLFSKKKYTFYELPEAARMLFGNVIVEEKDKTKEYKDIEDQAKRFYNYKGSDSRQLTDITKSYIEHFYKKGHSIPVYELPTQKAADETRGLMFNENNMATNREFYDPENPLTPSNRIQYSQLVDEYPQSEYLYNVVGAIGADNPMFPSGRQINIYEKDEKGNPIKLEKTIYMGADEKEKSLGTFAHNFHQINYDIKGKKQYKDNYFDYNLDRSIPMEINQQRFDSPTSDDGWEIGDRVKVGIKFKVGNKEHEFPPRGVNQETNSYFNSTEEALESFKRYYDSVIRSKR